MDTSVDTAGLTRSQAKKLRELLEKNTSSSSRQPHTIIADRRRTRRRAVQEVLMEEQIYDQEEEDEKNNMNMNNSLGEEEEEDDDDDDGDDDDNGRNKQQQQQSGDTDEEQQQFSLEAMMNELVDADSMQVTRRLVIIDAEEKTDQVNVFLSELKRQQLRYTHYYTKQPFNTCNIHFKVPLRKNRRNKILKDFGLNLKCFTKKYNHTKHKQQQQHEE